MLVVGESTSGAKYNDYLSQREHGSTRDNYGRNWSSYFIGPTNGIPLHRRQDRGQGMMHFLHPECCPNNPDNPSQWGEGVYVIYNATCRAIAATGQNAALVAGCTEDAVFWGRHACCNNGKSFAHSWGRTCDFDAAYSPNPANPTRVGRLAYGRDASTCSNGNVWGYEPWVQLFKNDGKGGFTWDETNPINFHGRAATDAQFADLDNDGDLDVVFATSNQPNLIFENDGTGRYTEVEALRAEWTSTDATKTQSVHWSDGPGPTPKPEKNSYAVRAVDLDGDGDIDLLFGNNNDFAIMYINEGGALNRTGGAFISTGELHTRVRAAHRESPQYYQEVSGGPRIYYDRSNLQMPEKWSDNGVVSGQSWMEVGDFDGDGDPDALFASTDSMRLYEQTSQGYLQYAFAPESFRRSDDAQGASALDFKHPFSEGSTSAMAIFDADGDGDLDLFVAKASGSFTTANTNRMYFMRHCPTSARHSRWGCVACPANSLRDAFLDVCTECPENSEPKSGSCTACAPGNDRKLGVTACAQCVAGSATLGNQESCVPCAPGFAAPTPGSLVCSMCAAGSYAAGIGSVNCTTAPVGSYAAQGASTAELCLAGRFGDSAGRPDGQCSGACERGHHCPAGSTSATANKCPAGTFNNAAGARSASDCQQCPMGSYCAEAAVAATVCPAGRFGNSTGMSDGQCSGECKPGHYCPAGSTSGTANACPGGTYRGLPGATALDDCDACPIGFFCPQGSVAPEKCLGGRYGSAGSLPDGQCSGICARGHYCPAGSTSDKAAACPAGTFNSLTGARSITECVVCPIGSYCPYAAVAALKCNDVIQDSTTLSTGAKDPSACSCALGFYMNANSTCSLCPPGAQCGVGASIEKMKVKKGGYRCAPPPLDAFAISPLHPRAWCACPNPMYPHELLPTCITHEPLSRMRHVCACAAVRAGTPTPRPTFAPAPTPRSPAQPASAAAAPSSSWPTA